ncbi:MAG: hypothetical protein Q4E07_02535 [Eubacteriales bacterium]|nr:hypothetical protein [Eubacteriales bacterium]
MRNKRIIVLSGIIMVCLLITNAVFAIPHKHSVIIADVPESVEPGEEFTLRITLQAFNDDMISGSASISAKGLEFIKAVVKDGTGSVDSTSITINSGILKAGPTVEFTCYYTFKALDNYIETPTITVDGKGLSASCNQNHANEKYFTSKTVEINIIQETHEHIFIKDESSRVEPSCGVDGSIVLRCSCGETKTEVLKKTGEHSYGEEEILIQPTCESLGQRKRSCTVCKHEIFKDIDIVPCDYSGQTEETPATCTQDGEIKKYCVYDCGNFSAETILALGHDLQEKISPADCVNPKLLVKSCSRCDYKETVSKGFALGHRWGSVVLPEDYNCTQGGIGTKTCAVCQETTEEKIAPKAHKSDGLLITIKKASCTEDGYSGEFCTVCDAEITEKRVYFPATGHSFTKWAPPEDADCTLGYTESCKCDNCDEISSRKVTPEEHKYGDWYDIVMPLCNAEGTQSKKCKVCDYVYAETIPKALYHRYKEESQVVESTCTQHGHVTKTCQDCGYKDIQPLALKDHDWLEPFDVIPRTCTQDGSYKQKCSQCEKVINRVQIAEGHVISQEETLQEYSCEQDGIFVSECSVCKEEFKRIQKASGHYYPNWSRVKEPTCIEDGLEEALCLYCEKKAEKVLEKSEEYHKMSILNEIQKANCGQERIYEWVCEVCDFAERFTSSPVGEHQFGEWLESGEASCLEEGQGKRICSVCDKEEVRKTKPKGHSFTRWKTDIKSTCSNEGVSLRNCETCGFTETKSIDINSNNHVFGEWENTIKPTCDKEGEQIRICDLCAYAETKVAKPVGHKFTRWKMDYAPSCDQEGEAERVCEVCGEVETKTIPVSENKHSFSDWEELSPADCENTGIKSRKCKACGYEETGTIPALRHRFGAWKTQESSNCSKEGISARVCEKCAKVETKAIPISEDRHSFLDWEESLAPSCGIEGQETRKCSSCGLIQTRVTNALSHSYEPWSKVHYEDCTNGGIQTRKCKNCGNEETRTTEYKEHYYSKWQTGKANSCTASGETSRTCKRCGHVETKNINAKGHKPGRFVTVKKATAYSSGLQQRLCRKCGLVLDEREYNLSKEAMAVTFSPLGIPLNELLPDRTDTWCMAVPIYIGKPDKLSLPIIADNKYIIGEIVVTVTDGEISAAVNYSNNNTEELNILLHFYSSVDELTPKRIKYRYKGLDIAKPTSLNKFTGKEVIIMYLRIEGIYDERQYADNVFDIQKYEDDILKMYELIDKIS